MWCIPKQQSHHFVAGMKRVLKVYRRPYDPRYPVVCMDEMSKQLVAEVREKLPVRPGSPEKYDAHYLRRGECTVWMFGEPRYPAGGRWLSPNGVRRWIGRSKCARWRIYRVTGMRKPSRWCATT